MGSMHAASNAARRDESAAVSFRVVGRFSIMARIQASGPREQAGPRCPPAQARRMDRPPDGRIRPCDARRMPEESPRESW